jgi:hypothetical protein
VGRLDVRETCLGDDLVHEAEVVAAALDLPSPRAFEDECALVSEQRHDIGGIGVVSQGHDVFVPSAVGSGYGDVAELGASTVKKTWVQAGMVRRAVRLTIPAQDRLAHT